MLFDQCDEIRWRVPRQRGFCEVLVRRNEIFRLAINVGEITAPAAGDQDFLADAIGMLEHGDTTPSFAGLDCAEESSGSSAKDQRVKVALQE